MVRRSVLSFVLILTSSAVFGATPEEKLVEAELLELSQGDLKQAEKIYADLEGNEKIGERVRSLATLGLARCYQKRGQIEKARKVLTSLTVKAGASREIQRRARAVLKEIQTGKPENPRFDWVGELQKNPEIQARIFDYTMDLVDAEKAVSAARQLLALGSLATPVLEQAVGNSRDGRHRQRVALLLANVGNYSYLKEAFPREAYPQVKDSTKSGDADPTHYLSQEFYTGLSKLDAERTKRLHEAVNALDVEASSVENRAALQLICGVVNDLPKQLRLASKRQLGLLGSSDVINRVVADEKHRDVLRAAIHDDAVSSLFRQSIFEGLDRHDQSSLGVDDYLAAIELSSSRNTYRCFRALERLDALKRIRTASDRAFERAMYYYRQEHRKNPEKAPVGWGEILADPRLAGSQLDYSHLQFAADENPGFASAYRDFLISRPKGHSPSKRASRANWKPSPQLAKAMFEVLEGTDDVVSLAIALDVLALAGPDTVPAFEAISKIFLNHKDWHLRSYAMHALLKRYSSRPETGDELLRVLLADCEARGGQSFPEEFFSSPLAPIYSLGSVYTGFEASLERDSDGNPIRRFRARRQLGPVQRRANSSSRGVDTWRVYERGEWDWVQPGVPFETFDSLHQRLIQSTATPAGSKLYFWFQRMAGDSAAARLALRDLSTIEDPAVLRFVVRRIARGSLSRSERNAFSPELLGRLKKILTSRDVDLETRHDVLQVVSSKLWEDWLPFGELLASDDPIADSLWFWTSLDLHIQKEAGRRLSRSRNRNNFPVYPRETFVSGILAAFRSPLADRRKRAVTAAAKLFNAAELAQHAAVVASVEEPGPRRDLVPRILKTGDAKLTDLLLRFMKQNLSVQWDYDTVVRGVTAWPEASRKKLLVAALASPNRTWRRVAMTLYQLTEKPLDTLKSGLADSESWVAEKAFEQLANHGHADAAPLVLDLLKSPPKWMGNGNNMIEASFRVLEKLAEPSSKDPLIDLLDSRNIRIRNGALSTLEAIQKSIDKREEWKARKLRKRSEKEAK